MHHFNFSQGSVSPFEIKSFIFYMLLLLFSVFALSLSSLSHVFIGGLGILWGIFGLHRFVPLTTISFPQKQGIFLSLPMRILSRFSAQEDSTRQLIKRRFAKKDMVFIILLVFAYLMWSVYCSLYPNHFSALNSLWTRQNLFFDGIGFSSFHLHNFMYAFIQFIILVMACAGAISFAYSRQFTNIFLILMVPFLLIGFITALSILPTAPLILFPDIQMMKGIGWHAQGLISLLHSDFLFSSGTSLVIRFIQVGFIGTAFLYVLIFPVMLMLFSHLMNAQRSSIPALLGIFFLVLLVVLDISFIQSALIKAIEFLTLVVIMLCCARAGYYSK